MPEDPDYTSIPPTRTFPCTLRPIGPWPVLPYPLEDAVPDATTAPDLDAVRRLARAQALHEAARYLRDQADGYRAAARDQNTRAATLAADALTHAAATLERLAASGED